MARPISILDLIERKQRGGALDPDELAFLCEGVVAGSIPDYQLAAWLMAVWFRGMSAAETLAMTEAMVATGETLDWAGIGRTVVDKHSTGGVGDKTSLVLVPLIAAAGLAFAKMSGRGLGHTGGTLDKLEAIPGFDVNLPPAALRAQVARIGCALVGQSPELVPADGALYALRDVTRTVDSVPLIASSVMAKKLAAGASAIVLDVKYGAGAFMQRREDARTLARAMVEIGEGAGRRVRAVLSSMEQPLGRAVGNALEVREAIDTLRGAGPPDLWELTLTLGSELLMLAGAAGDAAGARERLIALRDSGAGLGRLRELVAAQGGDPRVVDDPVRLPRAEIVEAVRAESSGWVAEIAPRQVAEVVLRLGGARQVKEEMVDPSVGVVLRAKVGARVEEGEPLAVVHASSRERLEEVRRALISAFRMASTRAEGLTEPETEVVGR